MIILKTKYFLENTEQKNYWEKVLSEKYTKVFDQSLKLTFLATDINSNEKFALKFVFKKKFENFFSNNLFLFFSKILISIKNLKPNFIFLFEFKFKSFK